MSNPQDVSVVEELRAELERLRAENAALRARGIPFGGLKVSNKGAVSVYGINSLPVTLYKEPMLRLLDQADSIREFIKANDSLLKSKPEGFQSIRDEAEALGLDSVASVMLQRQIQNTAELKSIANKSVSGTQAPLPGMAATPVVTKKSR